MTNEEKIRLVLETTGTSNIREAAKALREMEQSVSALDDEIKSGAIKSTGELFITLKDGQRISANTAEGMEKLARTMNQFMVTNADGTRTMRNSIDAIDEAYRTQKAYEEQIWRTSRSVDDLQESHVELFRTMQSRVMPAMDSHVAAFKKHQEETKKSAEDTRRFGQNMLTASYFVDDMQYGLRGIVNNVPQMVQAFGGGALAAGGFGIAMVGINQAISFLGPLFESTSKQGKNFNEMIGDFAKGTAEGKLEVATLAKEVEKLSKSFSPGLFESVGATLERMDKLIDKQSKVIEQNEKIQQQQADIKKIEDDLKAASKDPRADLATEFFGGQDKAGKEASIKSMMPEFMDQARKDVVQTELDKLISAGGIKTEWQKEFARLDIQKRVSGEDVSARARELSMAAIGSAQRGEFAGVERMARLDPNFAAFMQNDAADQAFNQGLTDRSRAIRNRNDRFRKLDARTEKALRDSGLKAGMPGGFADEIAIQQGRAAAGGRGGMIDGNAPIRPEPTEEELAAMTQQAEIRNAALAQFDPTQMAALRNAQAGTGGMRNRNLAGLRQRDMALFQNALVQRGMAPGAAEQAARESLSGGEQQFEQFSQDIGKNLGNGLRAQEATVEYFKMLNMRVEEFAQQMNMLMQQMNMMNGTDVRPQQNRARN